MVLHRILYSSLFAALISLAFSAQAQDAVGDTGKVAGKSAWLKLSPEQKAQTFEFAHPYEDYLRHAKSAALSEAELIRLAKAAGFEEFNLPSQVKPGARLILDNRGRAVLFAVIGSDAIETGSRMVAAHQDSPHINLKARPVVNAPGSIALLKTIPYGGIKRYQWANLPMALVGRIDTRQTERIADQIESRIEITRVLRQQRFDNVPLLLPVMQRRQVVAAKPLSIGQPGILIGDLNTDIAIRADNFLALRRLIICQRRLEPRHRIGRIDRFL